MKNRVRSALMAGAAAVALTLGGVAVPASAAGPPSPMPIVPWTTKEGGSGIFGGVCTGRQIDAGRVYDVNGRRHPTAVWRLYYRRANNGTNCLQLWDNKPGLAKMSAFIFLDDGAIDYAYDTGWFNRYAGAVTVSQANGRCVGIELYLQDNPDDVNLYSRKVPSFHCR